MTNTSFFRTEDLVTKSGNNITKFTFNQGSAQFGVFSNDELVAYSAKLDKLHTTDFFGISFYLNSDFHAQLDGSNLCIESNSIVMEYPGQIRSYLNQSRPTESIHICFSQVIYNKIRIVFPQDVLEYIYIHPNIKITDEKHQNQLVCIFWEMRRAFLTKEKSDSYMAHMTALLIEALVVLAEQVKNQTPAPRKEIEKDKLCFRFIATVNNYFSREHKVAFYVLRLNTTHKKLARCILEKTGAYPKDFIDNRIIEESKYLLQSEGKSLKEVAFILGFKEQSHFTNFFKQRIGITPTEFVDSCCL